MKNEKKRLFADKYRHIEALQYIDDIFESRITHVILDKASNNYQMIADAITVLPHLTCAKK